MTLRYREIERAANLLHVTVQPFAVRAPEDFANAFGVMARQRPDALFLVSDALTTINRKQVLEFVAAHRIPAMYEFSFLVQDGGLISYGAKLEEMFRRTASYVDRILKGAKPGRHPSGTADSLLPVHQSQKRQGDRTHNPADANPTS